MSRAVSDVRLVASVLLEDGKALPEQRTLPLVDVSLPMIGFSPFEELTDAAETLTAATLRGSRARSEAAASVRMNVSRSGAPAESDGGMRERRGTAVPQSQPTRIEEPPVFSFRRSSEKPLPGAEGKPLRTNGVPVARTSDLLRGGNLETGASRGSESVSDSVDVNVPSRGIEGSAQTVSMESAGAPARDQAAPAEGVQESTQNPTPVILWIDQLARDLLSQTSVGRAPVSMAAPETRAAVSTGFPDASPSSPQPGGQPRHSALTPGAGSYPEIFRTGTNEPVRSTEVIPGAAANLSPTDLADLVNEALVEQARRHGVDLS
jgi:hypothetical protein